jgi:hypothetical protein
VVGRKEGGDTVGSWDVAGTIMQRGIEKVAVSCEQEASSKSETRKAVSWTVDNIEAMPIITSN